ncbi:hypothetical protein Tco_0794464 [Tanacetum coccineum]
MLSSCSLRWTIIYIHGSFARRAPTHRDSLNSAAGGNFLDKMPRDCLRIIESKSKVRNSRNKPVVAKVSSSTSTPGISPDVAELKDMVKALLLDKKSQAPTPVKAVEESCVTCGGAHSYRNCPATNGNVYHDNIQDYVSQVVAANYNQGNTGYRAPIANQIRPPGFPPILLKITELGLIDVLQGEQPSCWKRSLTSILIKLRSNFQEVLLVSPDLIASGNPNSLLDPIVSTSSPTLTPFGDSDFLLLEEADAFLALEDDITLPEVDDSYYDLEGELKVCKAKTDKSSIDEPSDIELKDLPPHLEYAFLEGDDKLPVIIAKDLSVEEKAALIKVLKSRK